MGKKTFLGIEIVVEHGDALGLDADVLALKHANKLYGADRAAVQALATAGIELIAHLPKPSGFYITSTKGAIAAGKLLFVGVGPLRQFGYKEIRAFGCKVLELLADEVPTAGHIALTIHGPGYGLDEKESFESELAGLLDAISRGNFPTSLKRITVVEGNAGRARRLSNRLNQILPSVKDKTTRSQSRQQLSVIGVPERLRSVGYDSQSKPYVFVAMPFAEEMDDVFHYGIQGAVNSAGFLCERADLSTFTGDVLEWVKKRIESASLVVADLSDNVYLEVGYAWGCGRPTVLLVKDTAHLKFDVKGQRCIPYKKIKDLENSLRDELEGLKGIILNDVHKKNA